MEPDLGPRFLAVLKDPSNEKYLTDNVGLYAPSIRKVMVLHKGLTKMEADELAIIKNQREQFRRIMKKVVEKNDLSCYIAFSRALENKNAHVWSTAFPFATKYECLKIQPQKPKTVATSPKPVAPEHPHVMWICENESIFKTACDVSSVPEGWTTKAACGFKYCDASRYLHYNIKIWVFYPTTTGDLDVADLLAYFNKTQYCIYTGTGVPFNKPIVKNGDICVASSEHANSLMPQINYTTRELEMCNEGVAWRCGRGPSVIFGYLRASGHSGTGAHTGIAGTGARAKAEIISKSGSDFYSRVEPRIPHIAIFAVSDDKSSCKECGSFYYEHTVTYTHTIILDICEKIMLLECCRGRQAPL